MHPHSHPHSHAQHSHHAHADDSSRRIGVAFFLNLSFTLIELIGGLLTNSTAILADAVHDLGDSFSIGTAWYLNRLGKRTADPEFTYGYRRLSLFGALMNALVLIIGSVWILGEAIPRLFDPIMPMTEGMLALAILGVTVNGFAAYRLSAGQTLNEKVLNWHLLEDVLGWVAVLIVALVLQWVHWPILDPLLSICFTLFILFNVMRTLRFTGKLFFQATPDQAQLAAIHQTLLTIPGISDVHHAHLWSLDGEQHVLTAHIILEGEFSPIHYQSTKNQIAEALKPYRLAHTTIEIEASHEPCRDKSD
jgi:cobalt-zinc-cadmium efflux system protein